MHIIWTLDDVIEIIVICPLLQVNSRIVGADIYQSRRSVVANISVEITFAHLFPGSEYSLR